ncbi:hypothetical protein AB0D49_12720 [Streptomyces sp. NPDC048290]|uniref:hypothetical protein n=1 Tax=Streptomyces sp. NPDC048290 TaxID=3155811 RepID=UPI00342B58B4
MSDTSYNSDLAYKSPSSDSSDDTFRHQVGPIVFEATSDTRKMKKIAEAVEALAAESSAFQAALSAAGEHGLLTVRFGTPHTRTGAAEWKPEDRVILLDPNFRAGLEGRDNTSRLIGACAFETLNAASESERLGWEEWAGQGWVDYWAEQQGWTGGQYFGLQMEHIEFNNTLTHRQIMEEVGKSNSSANLFKNQPRDFNSHYLLQSQPGPRGEAPHVETSEARYNVVMSDYRRAHGITIPPTPLPVGPQYGPVRWNPDVPSSHTAPSVAVSSWRESPVGPTWGQPEETEAQQWDQSAEQPQWDPSMAASYQDQYATGQEWPSNVAVSQWQRTPQYSQYGTQPSQYSDPGPSGDQNAALASAIGNLSLGSGGGHSHHSGHKADRSAKSHTSGKPSKSSSKSSSAKPPKSSSSSKKDSKGKGKGKG